MADIFISYATVDRLVVDRLVDALKACGWSVWWDHRSLRGGQRFDRIIEEAIRSARVVIVIWSKISVEREWVLDEATLALRMKKLVPLRIDMTDLPMRFTNIHTIDFSSWTGETEAKPFRRLVKDLTQQAAEERRQQEAKTKHELEKHLDEEMRIRTTTQEPIQQESAAMS